MVSLVQSIPNNDNYSDEQDDDNAWDDSNEMPQEQQKTDSIGLKIFTEQKKDIVTESMLDSLGSYSVSNVPNNNNVGNIKKKEKSPRYIKIKQILESTELSGNILNFTPTQIYMIDDNKENNDLSEKLAAQIGKENLTLIKSYIQEHGLGILKKVLEKKSGSICELNNGMSLVFKKSGKIYLQIRELGRGKYKVTKLNILVASAQPEHIATDQLIFRAFSAPIPVVSSTNLETDEAKRSKEVKIKAKLLAKNQLEMYFNRFLKQASKFYDLSHVCVIKSISSIEEVSGTTSELLDCNVDAFLKKNRNLSSEELLSIAKQAAEGVSELHQLEVVHRDIKPDNLLIKREEEGKIVVKVTDFGLSTGIKGLKNNSKALFTPILDPYIVETGLSTSQTHSTSLDIYQLGMTLTMILTRTPLEEFNEMRKRDQELKNFSSLQEWKQHPEQWGIMDKIGDEETKTFLIKMLNPIQPTERPSIDEVVAFLSK